MDPAIVPGTGAGHLGEKIAHLIGVTPVERRLERFPDGELDVAVEPAITWLDAIGLRRSDQDATEGSP